MKKMRAIFTLVGFFVAIFLLYIIFFTSPATPWEKTGTLSILTRTVPGLTQDTSMVLGIDDMQLYQEDGEVVTVTIRTRRIELVSGSNALQLVVDATVPIGNYTGFGFTLRSPELRNSWEGDVAPEPITLISDDMELLVPYTIEENTGSTIILAFETLSAIHTQGEEKVYLPVVQIETRTGSTISTNEKNDLVSVQGGTIHNSATFGMDWDTRVRYNFRAKPFQQEKKKEEQTVPQEDTVDGRNTSTTSVHEIDTETDGTLINKGTTTASSTDPEDEVGSSTKELFKEN